MVQLAQVERSKQIRKVVDSIASFLRNPETAARRDWIKRLQA